VWHLEKGRANATSQVQELACVHRYGADAFRDPGCRAERHLALAQQRPDTRSMIGVTVGQEHDGDVREVAPDPGQEPFQSTAREPGIHEETSPARLQISRVARAAARKDAEPQKSPPSSP
jgi:hypothetical protein